MDLWKLKQAIDEAQKGQEEAAKAVISELDKLGIPSYCFSPNEDFLLREVGDKKEYLEIYSYTNKIDLDVAWWISCHEADCDDRDCEGPHHRKRKATADEVVFALSNYLRNKLRGILAENRRLREIAGSIAEMSPPQEDSMEKSSG
jgi:hypothetical protein